MSFKYKVDDKVRIKDLTKCEDIHPYFTDEMFKYSGKTYTIKFIDEYFVTFSEIPFNWHFDWLQEPLTDKIKNILNR